MAEEDSAVTVIIETEEEKVKNTCSNINSAYIDTEVKIVCKYQPSGAGGTRSPPATPHHLQNPKWPPGGPKMAHGVWKGVYP